MFVQLKQMCQDSIRIFPDRTAHHRPNLLQRHCRAVRRYKWIFMPPLVIEKKIQTIY